ncbi:MAG TPA: glycosyltransferase family 39 protein [Candidatus Dormibacteraeota bacterium]
MTTSPAAVPAGSGAVPGRGWRSLTVPLVMLLVLRLPSLFEPHWYTDEAGYANTAWEMAHGKVLYLTAWNNKPPLLFWLYQLSSGGSGSSILGLHLLSTGAEVSALVATWVLARRYLSRGRCWIAMLVAAFFLATPVFNGDLALPENFLIGLTPWAMVAVLAALRSPPGRRALAWALLAGLLLGAAILIQQTALADLVAAALVLVAAGRRGWRLAAASTLTAVLLFGAVLAPFLAAAGFHHVFFLLATSYSSYTTSSLKPSLFTLFPRFAELLLLLGGVFVARRWPAERLLPWVWLATVLFAYSVPNRAYPHFLLPAVPAGALLVARAGPPDWRAWPARARLAMVPLLCSLALGVLVWVSLTLAGAANGSLFTFKLTGEYYPAFVGRLTGALTMSQYVSVYAQAPLAEDEAVGWIKRNHLEGVTAVVWSPDSWAYRQAGLRAILPEPTIYENRTLLGEAALLRRVRQGRPVVVLLTSNSYTEYGPIFSVLKPAYTEVQVSAYGELWIRSDVAIRVLTRARYRADSQRSATIPTGLTVAAQVTGPRPASRWGKGAA